MRVLSASYYVYYTELPELSEEALRRAQVREDARTHEAEAWNILSDLRHRYDEAKYDCISVYVLDGPPQDILKGWYIDNPGDGSHQFHRRSQSGSLCEQWELVEVIQYPTY